MRKTQKHFFSPSGMLNRKLCEVFSLMCTHGNSNIAITIRHCNFQICSRVKTLYGNYTLPTDLEITEGFDVTSLSCGLTPSEMATPSFHSFCLLFCSALWVAACTSAIDCGLEFGLFGGSGGGIESTSASICHK